MGRRCNSVYSHDLRNDFAAVVTGFDANGESLTFEVLTVPSSGTLSGTAPSLTYTPNGNFEGTDSFTFRVSDGTDDSLPATVTLDVRPEGDAPVIDPTPLVPAAEGDVFEDQLEASDVDVRDDCPLTWELLEGPPGLTVDPDTGALFWIPDQDGVFNVRVRVTDCEGDSAEIVQTITVDDSPEPPVIVSAPVRFVTFPAEYVYDVLAIDPDQTAVGGQVAEYRLTTAPAGMTIDPPTGVIRWPVSAADVGVYDVEVVAIDGTGLISDPQRFDVTVQADDRVPTVTVTAEPFQLLPGETSLITVAASDDDSALIDAFFVNGAPETLTLDGTGTTGTFLYTATSAGVVPVLAEAVDPSSNRGQGSTSIRVLDAGDSAPPVVELRAPETDAELTYLHDVIGTVQDDNLFRWTVALKPTDDRPGRSEFFLVFDGTTNIDGVLGELDTTQLENGRYVLRLQAEDANGQVAEDRVPVQIAGEAKLGIVQLSFTDLVIDDVGFDLAVVRTYDSRRAETVGDFGHGWELDLRAGKIQHNRPLGQDHLLTNPPLTLTGGVLQPCTLSQEIEFHFTEVRISDTEVYVFRPDVTDLQPISGSCTGDYGFEYVDGTTPNAELIPFGNRTVRATPIGAVFPSSFETSGLLTDIETGAPYNPQDFQLRLEDGRVFDINLSRGVTRFEDRNGNVLLISERGLTHSSGRSMTFDRDAQGRIRRITDGTGREVSYTYDDDGNLVSFDNPLEQRTTYEYREPAYPHHLTDIVDFRGVRVAAMTFEDDGRLDELCDADGVCFDQDYDLAGQVLTRFDGLGRPTRTFYNSTTGNIEETVDGEGNSTKFGYLGRDIIRVENAEGEVTLYPRNTRGQLIARVDPHPADADPEDYTTRYEYEPDERGFAPDLTAVVLPTGARIEYSYDDNHNPTETRDQDGNVIFGRTFDEQGRLTTFTDRTGTTLYDYAADSDVHATRITDPFGTVFDLAYDGEGNLARLVKDAGTASEVVHTYRYDPLGRRQFTDYGRGVTVTYAYTDDRDDWTRIIGPTFGEVTRRYSGGGRLVEFTEPNGDRTQRFFDAVGNLRVEVDPVGVQRGFEYDGVQRLIRATDSSTLAVTRYVRDRVGRVTRVTDAEDGVSITEYGDDGLVSASVDPRMGRTEQSQLLGTVTSTNPLGISTRNVASSYGLPNATVVSDATGETRTQGRDFLGQTQLDGAEGRPTVSTDPASRTRNYSYDGQSGLQTASDLSGASWTYGYELVRGSEVQWDIEGGNVFLRGSGGSGAAGDPYSYVSGQDDPERDRADTSERQLFRYTLERVTSAEGQTVELAYGPEGEVVMRTLPTGGVETRQHDAAGRMVVQTLAYGTTRTFTYNAAGELLERTTDDGEGPRSFTYGPRSRVETATSDAGTTTYRYDDAGRLEGMTNPHGQIIAFEYDRLGETTAVSVRANVGAPPERTEYGYDAASNLISMTEADGDVVIFGYDAGNRLTSRTLPNGVTTEWTYDLSGFMTDITHRAADGSVIASRVYTRLPTGEPLRIERFDGGAGSTRILTVDAAGRIETENITSTSGDMNAARRYQYDLDGNRTERVLDEGTPGEVTETLTLDPGSELRSLARSGASTTPDAFTYDDAGRLTALTRGGIDYGFTYNSDDALAQVTRNGSVAFEAVFDAENRRIGTRQLGPMGATERRFLIAPSMGRSFESPHLVTNEAGAVLATFVYHGEHALSRTQAGTTTYYLRDAVGSVVAVIDDTGAALERFDYDAFGNTLTPLALPTSSAGDVRFQGMWQDAGVLAELGAYYVRARVYDTATGRFTTRDAAEGQRLRPETYWPYVFASGNPTIGRDPLGLFDFNIASTNTATAISFTMRAQAVPNLPALFAGTAAVGILCTAVASLGPAPPGGTNGICDLRRQPGDEDDSRPTYYHYTNVDGYLGVLPSGVIRRGQNGLVLFTLRQLSPPEVVRDLFLGRPDRQDRGDYVAKFQLRDGVIPFIFKGEGNTAEFAVRQTLRNGRSMDLLFLGENPF